MEPNILLLLAFLGGFLLLFVMGRSKTRGRLPPGPRPLPILGNLLQMDRGGLLKSFIQFREKYGDVFTVHLGPRPVVMLCGTDTIREALVDQADSFSGRAPVAVLHPVIQGYGMIFTNGETWKTLRRFSLATMREFGMGKQSLEERIREEAQYLVEELRKLQGAPWNPCPSSRASQPTSSASLSLGERFDYKDPQFLHLMDLFFRSSAILSSFSSQMFELFSGFLKYFPGEHREMYRIMKKILHYISQSVEKHRETLDPSAPRDFIDAYLIRMEKEKSNKHTDFHHQNLIMSVMSLFFAGTETTSTTIRYTFLILLKYPDVAEKIQKEIEQVIGSHRLPTLDDRTKMPYTDAVIYEVQRFSDLIPMSLPHKVTKDTVFRGYLIPKDTEVYPILSSALHDPRYFEHPDAFNPDHFLDANGELKKSEAFMPFSIGKRMCLGENIARNELFLFTTTILQNFSLASPKSPQDIDLSPKMSGVGKIPQMYEISFLARC